MPVNSYIGNVSCTINNAGGTIINNSGALFYNNTGGIINQTAGATALKIEFFLL